MFEPCKKLESKLSKFNIRPKWLKNLWERLGVFKLEQKIASRGQSLRKRGDYK